MAGPLQEKRRQEALAALARLIAKREDTLVTLARLQAGVTVLRRQLARYDRLAAVVAAPASTADHGTTAKPAPVPAGSPLARLPAPGDGEDIPGFLTRQRAPQAAQEADDAARSEIEAKATATKRTRAQVRIERLKAKQAGETRRMPLSGRAALAHILGKPRAST